MNIQPIVEGDGEVNALPVLLRRLCKMASAYSLNVNPPIRRPRSELVRENGVRKTVRLARKQHDCAGILILCDSDDDCPKDLAPNVQAWGQAEASPLPCYVVMATREYEAWFLATIESLRGVRGILADATSYAPPESPRSASEELRRMMQPNRGYSKPVDQPALTAKFDMAIAYQRCRSFRRMVNVFGLLAAKAGIALEQWPPSDWTAASPTSSSDGMHG
jgi:Domain of unknown function (DUF4276)